MTGPTVLSFGGGVQSMALLVLIARRQIDVDAAVWANVGDDSERRATLRYVAEVAHPYAAAHGIPLHEVRRTRADGTPHPTLRADLLAPGGKSIRIPARMANGAPGNRSCTQLWKSEVVRRWCQQHGASAATPATVLIGFSADETERIGRRPWPADEQPTYPLVDLGITRAGCRDLIASAGLPQPPKSACYFCPFHTLTDWQNMARDEPTEFAAAVEIEQAMHIRRAELGKDPVYLTRHGRPLADVITAAPDTLPGFEGIGEQGCDEGSCFT